MKPPKKGTGHCYVRGTFRVYFLSNDRDNDHGNEADNGDGDNNKFLGATCFLMLVLDNDDH